MIYLELIGATVFRKKARLEFQVRKVVLGKIGNPRVDRLRLFWRVIVLSQQ